MDKLVDYYFTPASPWTYLGHARFSEIARRCGATVRVKPVDYGVIFPRSGGLPLAKRAPQRQAYRLAELKRWQAFLGVPLNPRPRFFPVEPTLAAELIIAAEALGSDAQMRLTGALLRALWVEERDIADAETLKAVLHDARFDAARLLAAAPQAKARYEAYTQEALAKGVFGAPTYVYRDELFWGQDRLDFVERALAA